MKLLDCSHRFPPGSSGRSSSCYRVLRAVAKGRRVDNPTHARVDWSSTRISTAVARYRTGRYCRKGMIRLVLGGKGCGRRSPKPEADFPTPPRLTCATPFNSRSVTAHRTHIWRACAGHERSAIHRSIRRGGATLVLTPWQALLGTRYLLFALPYFARKKRATGPTSGNAL